jgi:hypothetical protein
LRGGSETGDGRADRRSGRCAARLVGTDSLRRTLNPEAWDVASRGRIVALLLLLACALARGIRLGAALVKVGARAGRTALELDAREGVLLSSGS